MCCTQQGPYTHRRAVAPVNTFVHMKKLYSLPRATEPHLTHPGSNIRVHKQLVVVVLPNIRKTETQGAGSKEIREVLGQCLY